MYKKLLFKRRVYVGLCDSGWARLPVNHLNLDKIPSSAVIHQVGEPELDLRELREIVQEDTADNIQIFDYLIGNLRRKMFFSPAAECVLCNYGSSDCGAMFEGELDVLEG